MDNQLEPEIEQRIRTLCDEIAVAYDVDDDLREELCGHVEDKVLGYLNGEVPVSEDDAFMLAREHFGNRRRLKELLSDVHHVEATGALWRRVAAGFVVMFGINVVAAALKTLILSLVQTEEPSFFESHPSVLWMLDLVFLLGSVGLVVTILVRQKRRFEDSGTAWFARWPAWLLWAAVVAVFLGHQVWRVTMGALGVQHVADGVSARANTPFVLLAALLAMWVVGLSTLWMWWCDSPPRSPKALRTAAGALALSAFVDSFLTMQFAFITESPAYDVHTLLTIGEGRWVWRSLSSGQIASLSSSLSIAVVIALVGWATYAFALWVSKGKRAQIVDR